ncbi:MAG TPA: hypothetical protein VNU19_03130 [Candidatus Acidoferrum sp.]|nr:hypothetical protein [Candidatus Acidoferrum sp.]
MAEQLTEGTTVSNVCKGGDEAIKAAVVRIRQRLGRRSAVEIVDDDENQSGP